jgi:hypothetical protein
MDLYTQWPNFANNTECDPSLPQFRIKSSLFKLVSDRDVSTNDIDAECERKAIKLLPIKTSNSRIVLF